MSQLEAIVVREKFSDTEGIYVAVLLDHFLVGEGETPAQAVSELSLVIQQTVAANQQQGLEAFSGLAPAPAIFRDRANLSSTSAAVHESGKVGGFDFEINGRQAA